MKLKTDFTVSIYKELLEALKAQGYEFYTVSQYIEEQPDKRVILLRHDVDDKKENSFRFAEIQQEMGIVGTYYFRIIPQSFNKKMIKRIVSMGHEIGYHYEDMDFANGDPKKAIKLFENHLSEFANIVNIKTICMHGSPLSKYDNRELWNYYDYHSYGIIGEPYFDLDFSSILYLTDTGRKWDGNKVSIRDRSPSQEINVYMKGKTPLSDQISFRSTNDIISALLSNNMPEKVMFNFHPQRWTNEIMEWVIELLKQNSKNMIKWGLNKVRNI